MPHIDFNDNGQQTNRGNGGGKKEGITGWLQDTFNISRALARKGLLTVGLIALIVSLYFWAQLLL